MSTHTFTTCIEGLFLDVTYRRHTAVVACSRLAGYEIESVMVGGVDIVDLVHSPNCNRLRQRLYREADRDWNDRVNAVQEKEENRVQD